MDWDTAAGAAKRGYGKFNNCPHLCVDVPDGNSTITCRTSNGELLTFAFVSYEDGAPPACVDVHHKTTKRTFVPRSLVPGPDNCNRAIDGPPTGDEQAAMNVICFSGGSDAYRSVTFPGHPPAKPTTLVGILLY